MLKRIACIACIGMWGASQAFAGITDDVKKTVDEVVRIVSNKETVKNQPVRRQELKRAISAIFDFGEMGKRALGMHWKALSPAERDQFVDLFATLLENTYSNKIESYHNEKILYLKESIDGTYAELKTKIITSTQEEYSLDYRLLNENGTWMIYDVVIEGLSLVSNYRSQFNSIISSQGYDGLLKKLQTKSDEIKTQ